MRVSVSGSVSVSGDDDDGEDGDDGDDGGEGEIVATIMTRCT